MFCCLTNFGECELVNLVFGEEVVDCESEGAFECCGRRHSGAEGHVTCKCGVETFHGHAEFHHFTANTKDETEVSGGGSFIIVEGEFHIVLQVDGVGTHLASSVGLDFSDDALLHCAGENETAVIVGVFANEVDATGRSIDRTGRAVEVFDETAANVFNCKFHGI